MGPALPYPRVPAGHYRDPAHAVRLMAQVMVHPESPTVSYCFHPGFEVGVVLAGEHECLTPDLIFPVGPGDVWLASAWEMHGYRRGAPRSTVVWVLFSPEYLGEEILAGIPWLSLFGAPAAQRPRVNTERLRARALSIGGELQEEVEARAPGWEEAVRCAVLRLLLTLRREWEPPPAPSPASTTSVSGLTRVMPAMEALHTAPGCRLSLARAAAACELSPSRFSVLFHRAMGMSFGRYCLRARMAQVAQRLIATDEAVEDIAAQFGFTDGSHLHRLFVRHYGTTPAAYRREMR